MALKHRAKATVWMRGTSMHRILLWKSIWSIKRFVLIDWRPVQSILHKNHHQQNSPMRPWHFRNSGNDTSYRFSHA